MHACSAVDESHEIEFKALEDSLNMMSKGWSRTALPEYRLIDGIFSAIVLNDVLDLWVCLLQDS